MFSGSIVALITPFFQEQVDELSLKNLIEWHIEQETQAILVCGSTGEGALLTSEERRRILSISLETARGRIPIIMGCGAPSTKDVVHMVKEAETLGADAALVVTPYYVKPTPEGVFQHFQEITKASSLPIIIYNNPGRASVDLSVSLIARLATLKTVVALKDSSTDLRRPLQLKQAIAKPFCLLSGDDPTVGAYLAVGGNGCISVTANVAPKLCQNLMKAWTNQDLETFFKTQNLLFPLHEALLLETNPSPLKFAVSVLGKCHNEVRLPLTRVSANTEKEIQNAMDIIGLLS